MNAEEADSAVVGRKKTSSITTRVSVKDGLGALHQEPLLVPQPGPAAREEAPGSPGSRRGEACLPGKPRSELSSKAATQPPAFEHE